MYSITNIMPIVAIIKLIRPLHWIKNTFVFAPLIFSGLFTNSYAIKQAIVSFILFSIAASATYILNDYFDINADKQHPLKAKTRPLASGEVTILQATILLFILYSFLAIASFYFPKVILIIIIYLLMNVAYSVYFKTQPVLDIFIIATGFVLRVYAGAAIIKVPVSPLMCITTLTLSLYLAAIKRRQEIILNGSKSRGVLSKYSLELVDKYALISAAITILFYSFYVVIDKPNIVISIPCVIFGLYRYWFIVEINNEGESPVTTLFTDLQLQLSIASWLAIIIYSFWSF